MKTASVLLALMGLTAASAWLPSHARLPHAVRAAPRSASRVSMAAEGTVLVSGFLDAQERTDQFAFDCLHKHGVFTKIIALCPDVSFAKKRLISRTARYTGLTSVLEFVEGTPTTVGDKFEGVNSWLAFDADPAEIISQVGAAKAAGVTNIVAVVSKDVDFSAAESELRDSGVTYTFIRSGAIVDGKEGTKPFVCGEIKDGLGAEAVVTRDEAVRIAAECFMIESAGNKAFTLMDGDDKALAYLKKLRGEGKSRSEEIMYAIAGGLGEFIEEVKEVEEKKAAKKEAEDKPKYVSTQTAEEQSAEIEALIKKGQEKLKKAQEDELVQAAKNEMQINFQKQKWSEGGISDEKEYEEKYLADLVEDLRDRSYFDEDGVLNFVREEDLDQMSDEELAELDAELEAEEKEKELAGAKDE